MSKPWRVVQMDGQAIKLERDGEQKDVKRPTDKANLAVFLAIQPDEMVDDLTIENFLTDKA